MSKFTLTSAGQPICQVDYDAGNRWLRATWRGFINPQHALQIIISSLGVRKNPVVTLFLNDNSLVLNPWFDSLTWLRYAWEGTHTPLPACIAHVMQPGGNANVGDLDTNWTRSTGTKLQLFESVADAEHWLRNCPGTDPLPAPNGSRPRGQAGSAVSR